MKAAFERGGEKPGTRAACVGRLFSFLKPSNHQCGQFHEVQPRPLAGKRILIVDDDPITLKTTAAKLNQAGHQVATASDGAEAIGAVREGRPDMILLDIDFPPDVANGGVPCWDGFRLMYWLRGLQNTEGTRYIFISGTDSDEYKQRANNSGALAFLPKPIDHHRLLEVIAGNAKEFADCPQPQRWWTTSF